MSTLHLEYRIVGWTSDPEIACRYCGAPAVVLVAVKGGYDSWGVCRKHEPADADDPIAQVFAAAMRSRQSS